MFPPSKVSTSSSTVYQNTNYFRLFLSNCRQFRPKLKLNLMAFLNTAEGISYLTPLPVQYEDSFRYFVHERIMVFPIKN